MKPGYRAPLRLTKDEITTRYRGGETLADLAVACGVSRETMKKRLVEWGVDLRPASEHTAALRAINKARHDSPLWKVSADRWRELYWGPERPSITALAEWIRENWDSRCCRDHLRKVLVSHGIAIRTTAQQLAEERRLGRLTNCGGFRPSKLPPDEKAAWAAKIGAALKGRRQSRAHRRNSGLAHRKWETRICRWCGDEITRKPYRFPSPPERTFCDHTCCNRGRAWYKRWGNAPRPVILEKIRMELQSLGKGVKLVPADVSRIGERFGATDDEILDAYEARMNGL